MVWRNFFRKSTGQDEGEAHAETPGRPPERTIPAHVAAALGERQQRQPADDPHQRRIVALKRKRRAILYDIEQGELAASPGNPWQERIELLTEAMAGVGDDLTTARNVEPGPYHPVPATPISIGAIDTGNTVAVEFSIGDNRFTYSEDPDWAERGHQLARTELMRRTGDVEPLVPFDTPAAMRDDLRAHLADSFFVFASDLRDRTLDDEPLPEAPTLADLAAPCPDCGGWTDWRGTCQACARRNARIAELKREEGRLLDERASEAEERRRLVEGVPLARKRLRDVESDLADAGESID
jgi:hypothetical protein